MEGNVLEIEQRLESDFHQLSACCSSTYCVNHQCGPAVPRRWTAPADPNCTSVRWDEMVEVHRSAATLSTSRDAETCRLTEGQVQTRGTTRKKVCVCPGEAESGLLRKRSGKRKQDRYSRDVSCLCASVPLRFCCKPVNKLHTWCRHLCGEKTPQIKTLKRDLSAKLWWNLRNHLKVRYRVANWSRQPKTRCLQLQLAERRWSWLWGDPARPTLGLTPSNTRLFTLLDSFLTESSCLQMWFVTGNLYSLISSWTGLRVKGQIQANGFKKKLTQNKTGSPGCVEEGGAVLHSSYPSQTASV